MRNIKRLSCLLSLSLVILASCNTQPAQKLTLSGLDPAKFVDTIKGKATALYTLKNKNGMEVCITNFGGRVVSIMAPDKNGKFQDVVLGFDNIKQYADTKNTPSDYGASIGRYANRIKDGKITIDNKTIQLPKNNFGHCLHGGPEGWQYQVYQAKQIDAQTLKLTMDSPDGDANFPGHVIAIVTYKLLDNNALDIAYEATTDKKTVINMTNHSYFVLGGDPDSLSLDNILYVNADNYTPVD
nr:galactose mutarotase [Bacteroidaceae bacterium]